MAYVIIWSGSATGSRLQTLSSGKLLLVGGVAVALTVIGSTGLAFRLGRLSSGPLAHDLAAQPRVPPADSDERSDERALIERIGELSGRVIKLESEAATLAAHIGAVQAVEKRLDGKGTTPAAVATVPEGASSAMDALAPRGGPLIPADAEPAGNARPDGDDELGLSRLDRELDQVAATLDFLSAAAAPRELATMAYPGQIPISGHRITSGFGVRADPFTGRKARHTGLDISASYGTLIGAAGGGRVRFAGRHAAYGMLVEIDHGGGLSTRYAHLSRLLVKRGDVVLPRQQIAAVGSTGRSTGPHLHFEVLRNGTPVEPRDFLLHDGV
jgi:murein DD-endopeptidase MepM/ murein hydrolase activator NlpD